MEEAGQLNLARNQVAVLATLVEEDNDANKSGAMRQIGATSKRAH